MIDEKISFALPSPWKNHTFEADFLGPINYLVGPNGSGKSRFANTLLDQLKQDSSNARLLGTDRLSEMAKPSGVEGYFGDNFANGYSRDTFEVLLRAADGGSGVDTIPILDERLDLCIQVEATLRHLFGRDIVLHWESGNLVPKVVRRDTGESYRLDRDECHGIKELFVLLTHLYDHGLDYLIVDEPELNLHPQHQAFFMQQVRRITGRKSSNGKPRVVFLITHSPFILDLRSEDDVKSVISFDLKYSVPRQVVRENPDVTSELVVFRRLNAHHKQLFFADEPVFVEGRNDALIIDALMEARGVSTAAAGSCIIDCGGMVEVTHYLDLCKALGKKAHFVFDLDSLFHGRLRSCIGDDNSVSSLLSSAGVRTDFPGYIGDLDQLLTKVLDPILEITLDGPLQELREYLLKFGRSRRDWGKEQLAKARVAVMIEMDANPTALGSALSECTVENIIGRWENILEILSEKRIHVLPGGAIERYFPSFSGDRFEPNSKDKRKALQDELKFLANLPHLGVPDRDVCLADRYEALYDVVKELPSKVPVDFDSVLRDHMIGYVQELQNIVVKYPDWDCERIRHHMQQRPLEVSGVVSLKCLSLQPPGKFTATICVSGIVGVDRCLLDVDSETTRANMGEFRREAEAVRT